MMLTDIARPHSLVDKRADSYINPLGFSPLWFEPRSGYMCESQALLTDGQVFFFPGFSGFRPHLMNNRLDISYYKQRFAV